MSNIEQRIHNKYKSQELTKLFGLLTEDERKEFEEKFGNKMKIVTDEISEKTKQTLQKLKEDNEKYLEEQKQLQEERQIEQEKSRLELLQREKEMRESMERMNISLSKFQENTNDMVSHTKILKSKFNNVSSLTELYDTIISSFNDAMIDGCITNIDTIDIKYFITNLFLTLLTKFNPLEITSLLEKNYIAEISKFILDLERLDEEEDQELLKMLDKIKERKISDDNEVEELDIEDESVENIQKILHENINLDDKSVSERKELKPNTLPSNVL